MSENDKMLVATPLQTSMVDHGKPRVISEVKKATPRTPFEHSQPRICGELLHWVDSEGIWRRKRVVIRGGALHVAGHIRVALRRLHLRPGDRARSFALYDTACDSRPIAVFEAATDREYETWVKTIAIELMRQTPLDAIKYLDIMGLISPSNSEISIRPRRSSSSECSDSTGSPTFSSNRRCSSEVQLDDTLSIKYNVYSSSDEDYNSNNWKISNGSSCEDCRSARRTAKRALFKDEFYHKKDDDDDDAEMTQKSDYVGNGGGDVVDGPIKTNVQLRNTKSTKRIDHRILTRDIIDQMDSIFQESLNDLNSQGNCVQDNTRNKSLSENNINMYDFNRNVNGDNGSRKQINVTNGKDINRNCTENGDVQRTGPVIKKFDFGTIGYSRVYNVREGIQLKTYDLKSINANLDKIAVYRKQDTETRKKIRDNENRRKEKEENLKNLSAKCETDILKNLTAKWSKESRTIELKNSKNLLESISMPQPDKPLQENNSQNRIEPKKYFTLTDYQTRHSTVKESRSLSLNRVHDLSLTNPPREYHRENSDKNSDVQSDSSDEQKVEVLLQRCQNSDSYVPVKDKLMLFESLCRLGRRLARSSEDLVSVPSNAICKRARSMHDLSRCGGTGVREMCKYFETRSEPEKVTDDKENKYNTIAKGYRTVSQDNQMGKNDTGRFIKKGGHENGKRYSYFKQFREGNKIISYV